MDITHIDTWNKVMAKAIEERQKTRVSLTASQLMALAKAVWDEAFLEATEDCREHVAGRSEVRRGHTKPDGWRVPKDALGEAERFCSGLNANPPQYIVSETHLYPGDWTEDWERK